MDRPVLREGPFAWIDAGQGPVIVLLHGLLGSAADWSSVIPHFEPSYRVIVPVLPVGEAPSGPDSVAGLTDFVIAYLEARGLDGIHLVGHSAGGHLAILVAAAAPGRVATLTLCASTGLGAVEGPLSVSVVSRDDRELIRRVVRSSFHDARHATDDRVDRLYGLINGEPARAQKLIALARSMRRTDVGPSLGRITLPTCLIWGREDQIAPPAIAELFREALPDATMEWIEACGHAPMIEHPEIFNARLARWLASSTRLPGTAAPGAIPS